MNDLVHDANHGIAIDFKKITFGEWLDHWLETAIAPPSRRLRTYETYKSSINKHIKPNLGAIRLQELEAAHLERYYRQLSGTLTQTTLEHHHAIISGSLKSAQLHKYVQLNVARLVDNKPKAPKVSRDVIDHCWTAEEVRKFLEASEPFGIQAQTFYTFALDTGSRLGEICGLKWSNVNLEEGRVTFREQLVKPGKESVFGDLKTDHVRTITLGGTVVQLLKKHKKHQSELKMLNRRIYNDRGLVFAKEWNQMTISKHTLGDPLQKNNLAGREFTEIVNAAGIRRIKFHGLRHTCATLLLKALLPVHVVSHRLGHVSVQTTLDIYAHVLPDQQQEAAQKLEKAIWG